MSSRGTTGNAFSATISQTPNSTTTVGVTPGADLGPGIAGFLGFDVELSFDRDIMGLDLSISGSYRGTHGTVGLAGGLFGYFGATTWGVGTIQTAPGTLGPVSGNVEALFAASWSVRGYNWGTGTNLNDDSIVTELSYGTAAGKVTITHSVPVLPALPRQDSSARATCYGISRR